MSSRVLRKLQKDNDFANDVEEESDEMDSKSNRFDMVSEKEKINRFSHFFNFYLQFIIFG